MKNRLKSLIEQLDEFATSGTTSVESAVRSPAPSAANYSYFTPLHYEANYAYPLLIWLHSPDTNESQLKKIMPSISVRNYVAIAPRATADSHDETGRETFRWIQSSKHILRAGQRVLESVERAKQKFNVNPNRIFLGGADNGGTMAFRLAMQYPERFAGVLSIGGGFPTNLAPLARLHDARRLSVFVACGRYAERYPTDEVCENLRLFHTAGISVTLRQYPCADEIMPQMLSDMDRWMMEQVVPPQPSTEVGHTFKGLN